MRCIQQMARPNLSHPALSIEGSIRRFLYKGQRRSYLRCLVIAILVVNYFILLRRWNTKNSHTESNDVTCNAAPGLEDVFVSVRTGATEIRERLPVQLATNLQCLPHYAIFSDSEDDLFDQHIYDVLRNVSSEIKEGNSDFEFYWKLKEKSVDELSPSDPYLKNSKGNNGHPSKRAWILDKWKFLPMVEETWAMRNDAKWYFFMELDTYVFWPNLIQYLSQFDHKNPHYIGSSMSIDDQPFVHGGGGIIVSNAAMRMVTEYISMHRKEIEDFTAETWAGDAILGIVMRDAGVTIRENWPLQQIHSPSGTNFARSEPKRTWCAPVLTYHHMSVDEIWALADFERQWVAANMSSVLRHKHIFEYHIMPQIKLLRKNWDNFAGEHIKSEQLQAMTQEKCFLACRERLDCKQYSVENGICRMAKTVHLGQPVKTDGRDVVSGWMRDRILYYFHHRLPSCGSTDNDAFRKIE